ncbi:MAG: S-layer homology domain-containing protein, partial [Eubacteriales bacterium]|nr:S-layer homology domain-containing protein [Eubacteriales bacterium]
MRITMTWILTCVIIMAGAAPVYGTEYTDVTSRHWAYEAVNAMSEKAIIKGYPDGSFLPDQRVTCGEFIKMALIAGTGEHAGNAAAGHWASNYYDKALAQNYFTAHDIGRPQLGSRITRGDMALIISAILGDMEIKNYTEIQSRIKDVTYETEHEYAITKAYAAGILTGYTNNTFQPQNTLSRAEAAAVIYRLVEESKRIPPTAKRETTESALTYPTSGL